MKAVVKDLRNPTGSCRQSDLVALSRGLLWRANVNFCSFLHGQIGNKTPLGQTLPTHSHEARSICVHMGITVPGHPFKYDVSSQSARSLKDQARTGMRSKTQRAAVPRCWNGKSAVPPSADNQD